MLVPERMDARTLHLANLLLVAVLAAASMLALPHLPERIPMHFDLAGNPTAWARTSRVSWYALPAVAATTAALMWGAARVARRSPGLWNVPEKARFMGLSPAGRQPFVEEGERIVGWAGVAVTLALAGVQAAVYLAATGRMPRPGGWLAAATLLPVAVILVMAARSSLGMGARIRAAADAEGVTPPPRR